jgi:hypothetical protein
VKSVHDLVNGTMDPLRSLSRDRREGWSGRGEGGSGVSQKMDREEGGPERIAERVL